VPGASPCRRGGVLSESITVDSPGRLSDIVDLIHDCWFSLDETTFSKDTGIVEIPFARSMDKNRKVVSRLALLKVVEVPVVRAILRIHHVREFAIQETENIRRYDFNTIIFDPERKELRILTGIPVDLRAQINEFRIDLEVTEIVLRHERRLAFFS